MAVHAQMSLSLSLTEVCIRIPLLCSGRKTGLAVLVMRSYVIPVGPRHPCAVVGNADLLQHPLFQPPGDMGTSLATAGRAKPTQLPTGPTTAHRFYSLSSLSPSLHPWAVHPSVPTASCLRGTRSGRHLSPSPPRPWRVGGCA